jgi:hypothetical protein
MFDKTEYNRNLYTQQKQLPTFFLKKNADYFHYSDSALSLDDAMQGEYPFAAGYCSHLSIRDRLKKHGPNQIIRTWGVSRW